MSDKKLRLNLIIDRETQPELFDAVSSCSPRKRVDYVRHLLVIGLLGKGTETKRHASDSSEYAHHPPPQEENKEPDQEQKEEEQFKTTEEDDDILREMGSYF